MSNTKVSPTQNIDSELHQQAAEERPNKVTLAAIESAENDLDLHGPFSSIEELMNDLNRKQRTFGETSTAINGTVPAVNSYRSDGSLVLKK